MTGSALHYLLCRPEIDQHWLLIGTANQDVRWLYVAMQDAFSMYGRQSLQQWHHQTQEFRLYQWLAPLFSKSQQFRERQAIHSLHDQIGGSIAPNRS